MKSKLSGREKNEILNTFHYLNIVYIITMDNFELGLLTPFEFEIDEPLCEDLREDLRALNSIGFFSLSFFF